MSLITLGHGMTGPETTVWRLIQRSFINGPHTMDTNISVLCSYNPIATSAVTLCYSQMSELLATITKLIDYVYRRILLKLKVILLWYSNKKSLQIIL